MNQEKRNKSKWFVTCARVATDHPDGDTNIDEQVSIFKQFADFMELKSCIAKRRAQITAGAYE